MTRLWNIGALVGALVWFVALLAWPGAAVQPFRFVHQLVAVGPLIVVPLTLGHVVTQRRWWGVPLFGLWAAGAMCVAIAVRLPTGALAAVVAGGWVVVTGLLACLGASRIYGRWRRGELRKWPELCLDAALLYIPVGAIWLVADRAAFELMGFPLLIVVLTAAHFHFAGFAAPVMAGLAGRHLSSPGLVWKAGALAAVAGPPVVAAGITTAPLVEVLGSVFLAVGMGLLALLLIFVVGKRMGGAPRVLLTVAGLSILATMAFACLYALGEFIGFQVVQIPLMIATHGVANVFGFSVLGLVAFSLAPPPSGQ